VIGAIGEGSSLCRLVWTGVDFSVGVVAPPGERSVGAGRGVGQEEDQTYGVFEEAGVATGLKLVDP